MTNDLKVTTGHNAIGSNTYRKMKVTILIRPEISFKQKKTPKVLTGYEKEKGFPFIITSITWNYIMSEFEPRKGWYLCGMKTGALTKTSYAKSEACFKVSHK